VRTGSGVERGKHTLPAMSRNRVPRTRDLRRDRPRLGIWADMREGTQTRMNTRLATAREASRELTPHRFTRSIPGVWGMNGARRSAARRDRPWGEHGACALWSSVSIPAAMSSTSSSSSWPETQQVTPAWTSLLSCWIEAEVRDRNSCSPARTRPQVKAVVPPRLDRAEPAVGRLFNRRSAIQR
jgi:hypothetical protein